MSKENNIEVNSDLALTVREVIMSRMKVEGNKVSPVRREGEIIKEKTILDQEYKANSDASYKHVSLADIASRGDGVEDELDGPNNNLVQHTDAYLFNGVKYPVVACKTSTEVLDSLKEGKYMAISFKVEFSRMDSESLETNLKDFQPTHVNLPKRRISNNIDDEGFIVVEPSINGFKISCFMEDISEEQFWSLDTLNQWIEDYQGYLLEMTMRNLRAKGVEDKDLIKSQVCTGLIPKTRQKYESFMAMEKDPDRKVITKSIRDQSRSIAEALNAQLELMPLTNQVVEFGCSVYTIEVTTKSGDQMGWHSQRNNISYFEKGAGNGRIVRLVGSKRKIPLVSDMTQEVKKTLEYLAPVVVTVFENCARDQLGIEKLSVPDYPANFKCSTKNIVELTGADPQEVAQMEAEYTMAANSFLNEHFKREESRNIQSLLGSLAQRRDE